ncbi:unnamed protein product [Vicia faba]|uniref:Cytosol aminopeptidase domain-containing protein n=1 Tax=Vicia faba TaxID=3906 RepID=A0AAV1AGS5_VICFA|nr:unnamed protein product [Vicia faba]
MYYKCACENMINRTCMRPGDILTTSNGKTIEVNNTDAIGSGVDGYDENSLQIKLLLLALTCIAAIVGLLGLDQSYPGQSKYGHSDGNYTETEKGDKKSFDDNASKADCLVMYRKRQCHLIEMLYFGDSNSHYSVENYVHDDINFVIPPKPPDQIVTGFLCCGESEFQRIVEDGNDKQNRPKSNNEEDVINQLPEGIP